MVVHARLVCGKGEIGTSVDSTYRCYFRVGLEVSERCCGVSF